MSVYEFEALQLFEQPEILYMTLVTFEPDGQRITTTTHTEDTVELSFE